MPPQLTVLLVGATGRTGHRVLEQLLGRGAAVRAIVRSAGSLPSGIAGNPGLTVVEADLLSLGEADLVEYVRGCDAVVSCLGHTISLKGIFGQPRDLVTRATAKLCDAVVRSRPGRPIKFILMSSVSVNHPEHLETRRGAVEKAMLWVIRALVPPARDNQRAADLLHDRTGTDSPFLPWVAVRPDTLLEGDVSAYSVHGSIVRSLFKPDSTNRANVAHFMCELITNPRRWDEWEGKLPVIVNSLQEGEAEQ